MKIGRIIENRNISILAKEKDCEDYNDCESSFCVYGKKYAYVEKEKIGSYQRFLGYVYYRYEFNTKSGDIIKTEEIDKLPSWVKL